jgi:Xaa-Pro aminopeptidase
MLELIRPEWSGRLQQIPLDSRGSALDAFVVSTPRNLRYLTGFDGTAGLLVHTRRETRLLVDGRYEAAARGAQRAGRLADVAISRVEGPYPRALAAAFAELDIARAGFESSQVTVAQLTRWKRAAPGVEWLPFEDAVERLRLIKDRTEIALFRRAGRLLAAVAGELRAILRPGMTELEVARGIDLAIDRAGFSGPSFPTIVASGPNSAHPHARPTTRRLSHGDPVLLDFGGVLDGYCVDLTRMAVIGHPSPDVTRLFAAVTEAHAKAVAAVRPGVPASAVDEAARGALEARGLGDTFLHATGHGLGLDVHEGPRIGRETADEPSEPLVPGMVFTIEPGAYLDGRAGVRLEDDLLVVEHGAEMLTEAPRDLLIV